MSILVDCDRLRIVIAGECMANPNPIQTKEFKAKQYKRQDNSQEMLSSRVLSVRVPISVFQKVYGLPDKSAWLRKVVVEAAKRELF